MCRCCFNSEILDLFVIKLILPDTLNVHWDPSQFCLLVHLWSEYLSLFNKWQNRCGVFKVYFRSVNRISLWIKKKVTFGTFGTSVILIYKNGDSVSETFWRVMGYRPRLSYVESNLHSIFWPDSENKRIPRQVRVIMDILTCPSSAEKFAQKMQNTE